MNEVGRRKPSPGVRIELGEPTILFLTVCAVRPASWLATEVVRESLVKIWRERLMCWPKRLILVRLGAEEKVETDPDAGQNETAACDNEVEDAEECFEGERFRKIEQAWRVKTCG